LEGLKIVIDKFFELKNVKNGVYIPHALECLAVANKIIKINKFQYIEPRGLVIHPDNIGLRDIESYFLEFRQMQMAEEYYRNIEGLNDKYNYISYRYTYDFTDEQISTIQTKISELREFIQKSDKLDDKHKSRLLNRLEDLQKTFNNRMSNLDKIQGTMIELGYSLGKFGEESKPMFDRINDIASIVRVVQATTEGVTKGIKGVAKIF